MGLHIIRRFRVCLVQAEIFSSDSGWTAPRMRVDRIAMGENGGILLGYFLRLLHRCGLHDENAADRNRLVVKRPGRHEDAVISHLVDVRHMRGLNTLAIVF